MPFWLDLRYACRTLVKTPLFALGVILTLALAIGANTAVFSVINAVLLKPLPFRDPSRIVMIQEGMWDGASATNFLDWRERARSLSDMAIFQSFTFVLTGRGDPEPVDGAVASAAYFSTLGVAPMLGRTFVREEDHWGTAHVVVLGNGLWRRRFHADRSVLGGRIRLNGSLYTVIGVMPRWQGEFDLWVPIENCILPERMLWRHETWLRVIARLRPGVRLGEAQAEMNAIQANIRRENPTTTDTARLVVRPMHEALVADLRPTLFLLAGAVALVLLIACANVANLLLVRAAGRHRELSIRTALGASRARILSQLLAESLLLSVTAGVAGAALAGASVRAIVALSPAELRQFNEPGLDWTVMGFTLAVSLATGLVFGLLPGLGALRGGLGLRGAAPSAGRRLRNALAIAEIAVSLVLLVGAGLSIRSFQALGHAPLGFSPKGLVVARMSLPRSRYPQDTAAAAFYNQVLDRIRALPGIEDAALTHPLPLEGTYGVDFAIAGREPAAGDPLESAPFRYISPNYFSVMAIPLRAGRAFTDGDAQGSEPVVIVSESLARRYFARQNALGRHLIVHRTDYPRVPRRIVGIVADVRSEITDDMQPAIYVPVRQMAFHGTRIVVRTAGNAAEVGASLRAAVRAVDPDQPLLQIRSMEGLLREQLQPWRFSLTLISTLATVALVLAVGGVFTVISHLVSQRTREFGIRIAVGARAGDIVRLVLGHGALVAIAGVLIGLAGAACSARLMESMVWGVTPFDPATYVAVALLLAAAAIAAASVPACRAARVDPIETLREE